MDGGARLAELLGALSLATDLAAGLGYETAVRVCVVATRLGRAAGLPAEVLGHVYYTALLRFIGCTAFAHETARLGAGDDLRLLGALAVADSASAADVLRRARRAQPTEAPLSSKIASLARLASDPAGPRRFAQAHCALAAELAPRLGMPSEVVGALGQMYERWDGRGQPAGLAREAIALPARTLHVAFDAVAHASGGGVAAALAWVREQRGRRLDPRLADALVGAAEQVLAPAVAPSAWDELLAEEPAPVRLLAPGALGEIAHTFALYVDVKSPWTIGHSPRVARIAEAAAERAGLGAVERGRIRLAALLHDLGRASVPNGIWDKPSALNPVERDRVRGHAAHTRRILGQSPLLAPLGDLAGSDHERLDGSGYPRGLPGSNLDRSSRLLAAADLYSALTEDRPHRPAFPPAEAARLLAAEVEAGRVDRAAAESVLAVAGQRGVLRRRGQLPAGLSEREVEVLIRVARGLSNKEIGRALFISPRTVQHHLAHIFEKIGVSTRAAAATFAVVHDLVSSRGEPEPGGGEAATE